MLLVTVHLCHSRGLQYSLLYNINNLTPLLLCYCVYADMNQDFNALLLILLFFSFLNKEITTENKKDDQVEWCLI